MVSLEELEKLVSETLNNLDYAKSKGAYKSGQEVGKNTIIWDCRIWSINQTYKVYQGVIDCKATAQWSIAQLKDVLLILLRGYSSAYLGQITHTSQSKANNVRRQPTEGHIWYSTETNLVALLDFIQHKTYFLDCSKLFQVTRALVKEDYHASDYLDENKRYQVISVRDLGKVWCYAVLDKSSGAVLVYNKQELIEFVKNLSTDTDTQTTEEDD